MNTDKPADYVGEKIYDDTRGNNGLNKAWSSSSSFEAIAPTMRTTPSGTTSTSFNYITPLNARVNQGFVGSSHSIDLNRLSHNDSNQRATRHIDFARLSPSAPPSPFVLAASSMPEASRATAKFAQMAATTRTSSLPEAHGNSSRSDQVKLSVPTLGQPLESSPSVSFQRLPQNKIKISTTRRRRKFYLKLCISISIMILIACIGLIVFASIKPCIFTRCHRLASKCIDRFPFWAQCICDAGYAGNGKTICVECGLSDVKPNLLRIVGGLVAVPSSWPFAVYIVQTYKGRFSLKGTNYIISNSWSCGGVLINHKTVLTAAHCIHDQSFEYQDDDGETYLLQMQWNEWYSNVESTLEVYVGVNDVRMKNSSNKLRIKKVNRHEEYDDFDFKNDIATIQLHDMLERSSGIQFACLPYNYSTSYPQVDRRAYIIGWGRVSEVGQSSDLLKNSAIIVLNNDHCSNVEDKISKFPDSQVCAGALDGSTDTCQGDSGGGLFVREPSVSSNSNNNLTVFYAAGIVSYGEGCARREKPGIYSRTSYFIDWIRRNSDF